MAERLAAKPVVEAMKEDLTKKVEALKTRGITPTLGIIRVGARPDDLFYEGGIKKTCEAIGMAYRVFEHPVDITQEALEKAVGGAGADRAVNGILMFSPLPKNLNERKIRSLIPVDKDVDCMTMAARLRSTPTTPPASRPAPRWLAWRC